MDILLMQIINKFGEENQLSMVTEELAELIQAVSKYKRSVRNEFEVEKALDMLTEEIADVEIMLSQLKIITNIEEEEINLIKREKLSRMKRKMEFSEAFEEVERVNKKFGLGLKDDEIEETLKFVIGVQPYGADIQKY